MNSALGWIGQIAAWFANWIPQIFHVKATDKAIKYVWSRAVVIEPGIHVYWPITTQVTIYPVVRQVMNLPNQIVQCDNTSVVVGGIVTFSIKDLYMFLVENYDAEDSMFEAAQTGIRRAVLAETVDSINSGRAKIDHRLTREVQSAVEAFGVSVEMVRLTTFAPTQVLSLLSDGSGPGDDE
jgi:regulator of protease activity HflC (stomatin/prohibitin superfamily)